MKTHLLTTTSVAHKDFNTMKQKNEAFKKVKITEAEMMQSIGSGKAEMFYQEFHHDDWCKTLKTGSGFDCNCSPDTVLYRIEGGE